MNKDVYTVYKRLNLCKALYGATLAMYIGSHSVICHPTQVNAPHLNPSQSGHSFHLTGDSASPSLTSC